MLHSTDELSRLCSQTLKKSDECGEKNKVVRFRKRPVTLGFKSDANSCFLGEIHVCDLPLNSDLHSFGDLFNGMPFQSRAKF